ncbi:PREDICTED: uncharacterized protein LOC102250930 [Myotis brandtii]|uniref:uncharacterized protein LOC102250930 n=1 Tax=Myotis brandtii TaxID=109478 RepID=UPI000703F827|nr:PREDICTED: uncharacterized protein LOC102250930 [Myotis brandtii]
MKVLKSCLPALKSDPMVLYQKAMQALNLLLQTFISENKSMDEVCFLLQHTEPWLMSDRSHERRRVVHTIFLLLKCVVNYVKLTAIDDHLTVAQHTQLILTLLRALSNPKHVDGDLASHLLLMVFEDHSIKPEQVGLRQGLPVGTGPVAGGMGFREQDGTCPGLPWVLKAVKELGTQYTQETVEVLLTLCHPSDRSQKAAGAQGAGGGSGSKGCPSDPGSPRHQPAEGPGCGGQLARKVMTLLYIKLKLRPPELLIRLSEQAELMSPRALDAESQGEPEPLSWPSQVWGAGLEPGPRRAAGGCPASALLCRPLQALGTIYELLYIREYKAIVHWAFAGILVGLLTQLHYLYELGVVENIPEPQEDILDMEPLGPCSMCLEALKGLFWTTNYWEVFAYLKLLRGWELFGRAETYTEGVTLLAR